MVDTVGFLLVRLYIMPGIWEDLASQPQIWCYTTVELFLGTLNGDLLSRLSQGSGFWALQ